MTRTDLPHINCPECGAENNTFANACWICRRPLYEGDELIEAEIVSPIDRPRQDRVGRIFGIWAFIFLGLGAMVVGLGVYAEEPGVLLPYLIVVAPLCIGVGVMILKGNQSENPWLRGIAMCFSALIVSAGAMVLLGIAAIIALLAFCFMVIAASGGF
ncbi:hypothetical protein [Bremerella sp. P1]|uniref:hypothetical protein n=1 Tax=Bremerella sp. P1 TaxID=3026424 RepID=UPI0023688ACB|nr:hypothetical protein [Bremerella sp. P1]WDI42445.1 hypothetical protein PSR63_00610 [Bremerella sp. P1]